MTSWNAESDRQLFLAILAGSDIATPKWDNIKMAGRTKESMRQRFQKLKKMVADDGDLGEEADTASKATEPTTPVKRGRGRPPKKRKVEEDSEAEKLAPTKRGRKPKIQVKDEDDEDAAEEIEHPKPKSTQATRSNKIDTVFKEKVPGPQVEHEAMTGAHATADEGVEGEADDLMA